MAQIKYMVIFKYHQGGIMTLQWLSYKAPAASDHLLLKGQWFISQPGNMTALGLFSSDN